MLQMWLSAGQTREKLETQRQVLINQVMFDDSAPNEVIKSNNIHEKFGSKRQNVHVQKITF